MISLETPFRTNSYKSGPQPHVQLVKRYLKNNKEIFLCPCRKKRKMRRERHAGRKPEREMAERNNKANTSKSRAAHE